MLLTAILNNSFLLIRYYVDLLAICLETRKVLTEIKNVYWMFGLRNTCWTKEPFIHRT